MAVSAFFHTLPDSSPSFRVENKAPFIRLEDGEFFSDAAGNNSTYVLLKNAVIGGALCTPEGKTCCDVLIKYV